MVSTMTSKELQETLYKFITPTYSDIKIEVIDAPDNRRQIYFVEEKFKNLFPQQRYHFLVHLIPDEFYKEHLAKSSWYELAPGENPEDLKFLDNETVEGIRDIILAVLKDRVNFVTKLDTLFSSESVKCFGDFRHSKRILNELNFSDEEQFDIFHVLMHEGGYCDCEILYNVFRESEYAQKYWSQR
jgi:hypothetical protein